MKVYLPRYRSLVIQSGSLNEEGPLMQEVRTILYNRLYEVQEAIDAVHSSIDRLEESLRPIGLRDYEKLMDGIRYAVQRIESRILGIGIGIEVEVEGDD